MADTTVSTLASESLEQVEENRLKYSAICQEEDAICNLIALRKGVDLMINDIIGDDQSPLNTNLDFDNLVSMVRMINDQIKRLADAQSKQEKLVTHFAGVQ